ncbi:uncharacterized protein [Heptranchias perlo]|uniref:uncharacterized protein isoform X1 n=1 Tax=Heptranchias perlo TaxID=212740 RepID=UPI003559E03C
MFHVRSTLSVFFFSRITLVLTVFITNTWTQRSPPPGLLQSSCSGRLFWIRLDASFLQDKSWTLGVTDPTGKVYPLTSPFATECGYTVSEDPFGNVVLRASVLACLVVNEGDDLFRLTVQIWIAAIGHMERVSTYFHTMTCSYFPWQVREILCEQNYMEVSVQRIIPGIENDYNEDWVAAVPLAQEAENSVWQVVFHLPEGTKTMTVNETLGAHYRIDTTVSRLLLRAPYNATEAEQLMVENVPISSIRSTTFYKQEWMIILIDTAVACPTDGITFTENKITWRIPRRIPSLSFPEEPFYDDSIVMGVNNVVLKPDTIAEMNYTLSYNDTNIVVTIPIGAEGGYYKSLISHGQYGILYYIELFVEHQWKLTKYTVIHPVATPFMLQPPIVTNNTIPVKRVFNITLESFLPDVKLVTLTVGTQMVTVDQADQMGFKIYETILPNDTKAYILEVPFENVNVKQEHLHSDIRRYTLNVIYTFNIIPENELFIQDVEIMCEVADIVLPKATGFCDKKTMYLLVTHGNLVHYWLPFIGKMLVTPQSAHDYGYLIVDNTTHILFGVPLSAMGVIYEELSLHGIVARLNLTLKDKNTLRIEIHFSVSCNFPAVDLAVCCPNGTMVVTAVVDTLPDLDPSKLVLRDGKCQPREFDHDKALFQFHVDSCGTTRTIKGNYLIYENEVSYPRELIPVDFPVITRDPDYRLTVSCRYKINNTLALGFVKGYQKGTGHNSTANRLQIVRGHKKPRHTWNIHSRIYKSVDYLDFYKDDEYPVVVNWTESLYFEVELLNHKDPQMYLLLDHCWMTTTPDHNSPPEWHIIQAGCENKEEMFVAVFHPVPNRIQDSQHLKRFEVKTLKLSPAEQTVLPKKVYFHCSVGICANKQQATNYSCNGQCIPGKLGQDSLQDYVSLGEVWLFAGTLEQAKNGQGGTMHSYWLWVLGSCSVIFLILVLILVKMHMYH